MQSEALGTDGNKTLSGPPPRGVQSVLDAICIPTPCCRNEYSRLQSSSRMEQGTTGASRDTTADAVMSEYDVRCMSRYDVRVMSCDVSRLSPCSTAGCFLKRFFRHIKLPPSNMCVLSGWRLHKCPLLGFVGSRNVFTKQSLRERLWRIEFFHPFAGQLSP